MSRSSRKNPDYIVGYGRPPQATQFKPGQSGNLKGRPKGARSVDAMFKAVITQRVTIMEAGKTRRVSAIEVMLMRLASEAMRGDQRAIKLVLALVDRFAHASEASVDTAQLAAEDQAILARYLSGSQQEHSDDHGTHRSGPREEGPGS